MIILKLILHIFEKYIQNFVWIYRMRCHWNFLLQTVLNIFHYLLDQPDPPTDVRIDIIDDTAKISWVIPSNQRILESMITLNNSKEGDVYLDSGRKHVYVRFPHSSFKIANLTMCSEYCVRITCISRRSTSKSTTQKFWMTSESFVIKTVHSNWFVH